jgi:hypothetical protein
MFTVVPRLLNLSTIYLPSDAQYSCIERISKFTLKGFLRVSVQSPSSGSILFEFAKLCLLK